MEIFLQAQDIIEFAIRIEENGERFYREAALLAEDGDVKTIFNNLADEEVGHKKTFRDILSKKGELKPTESFQGEYLAYLRDYIDNKAVFTEDFKNNQSSVPGDAVSAVSFAMQRELDSILYYEETKRFVSKKYHEAIDSIIEEERKHFLNLTEIKKMILNKLP